MRKDTSNCSLRDKRSFYLKVIFFASCRFLHAGEVELSDPALEFAKSLSSPVHFKSASGRYLVLGSSRPEIMGITKWIDDVMGRFEKIPGLDLHFDRNNNFRVILGTRNAADSSDLPSVEVMWKPIAGRDVLTLLFRDYYGVRREEALEGLCRLFIDGIISGHDGKKRSAPAWLYRGIAQSFYVPDREHNSDVVAGLWKTGNVGSVKEILESGTEMNVSIHGVFTEWLLSFPKAWAILGRIRERLAGDGAVDREWLAGIFAEMDPLIDLEESWDRWIFYGKNRVYTLGSLNSELIRRLRDEKLIYLGTFGIPVYSDVLDTVTFADLIRMKRESWMPALCAEKKLRLRVLELGRAREFAAVVDLYCEFLDALGKRRQDRLLLRMLGEADLELLKLEEKLEVGQ